MRKNYRSIFKLKNPAAFCHGRLQLVQLSTYAVSLIKGNKEGGTHCLAAFSMWHGVIPVLKGIIKMYRLKVKCPDHQRT